MEYKLETEFSAGSVLSAQEQLPPPTPPPISLSLSNTLSSPPPYTMSQHDCYGPRLKELSQEATLVLSNTRELDRVPSTE